MNIMKFKHLMVFPLLAIVFFASTNFLPKENAKKDQVLIEAVLAGLRQLHYQPQELNDEFSKRVYDLYMDRMDNTKRFFIEEDIVKLKKYELQIDDESSKASYEFFDLSVQLWQTRLAAVESYYEEFLSKPFDFSKDEMYETDPDKHGYARSEAELKDLWYKSLKYQVMTRVADMIEAENKKGDGEEKISYQELEKKARDKVLKTHKDWFHRLGRMEREKHLSIYINAITSAYDPHTNYLEPKDKQDFDISMSGRLEGIGARLQEDGIYIKVVEIVPGSPSYKQGELKTGDYILAVAQGKDEPVDVVDMAIDDAVQLIRGKTGTEVRLTVKKVDGSKVIIPIIRDVVVTEEGYAKSSILTDEDFPGIKIGFIHLPKFYTDFTGTGGRTCSEDMKNEVIKLMKENVDGIVIDLRFNGGGSLQDVVDMSGLFVEKGPMVQVKSKGKESYILEDEDNGQTLYDGPLVIMVNQYSASASEIMAAALQDYGRAVIVGSKNTFGKGTVQRFLDLDKIVMENDVKPLGSIKMTIQKFYRINGKTTQLNGVASDIVLPDVYQYVEVGEREEDYPLEWDEIKPAKYNAYNANFDLEKLKKASEKRVKANGTFALIEENAKYLKERRDDTQVTLNLNKYQSEEQRLERDVKKFDDIRKTIPSLQVRLAKSDEASIAKNDKNKARMDEWHKEIKEDIQIDETMAVINDMIKQQKKLTSKDN
jgi:carboxyl-terminal processing protease